MTGQNGQYLNSACDAKKEQTFGLQGGNATYNTTSSQLTRHICQMVCNRQNVENNASDVKTE